MCSFLTYGLIFLDVYSLASLTAIRGILSAHIVFTKDHFPVPLSGIYYAKWVGSGTTK